MPSSQKKYNPTESDIAPELLQFYGELKNPTDRDEVIAALREKLSAEISYPLVPLFTMWLHEYELYQGRDSYARSLEEKLELFYRRRFSRQNASLLPTPREANQILDLSELKNRFSGQRAFVIGNGPSLNKTDLTLLRDEITFGMNFLFLTFDKLDFQPAFYLVEDDLNAKNRTERIALQSDSVRIFSDTVKNWLALDAETIFHNFILDTTDYPGFPHFSVAPDIRTWGAATTSFTCLQLAYFFGFTEIYLIGFDHDHKTPPNSTVVNKNQIIPLEVGCDIDHFDPNYITPGATYFLGQQTKMTQAFNKARHAYSIAGRSIYNATEGGKLEIFERRDFNTVLASGHPAQCDGVLGVEWLRSWRESARRKLHARRLQAMESSPNVSIIILDRANSFLLHRTLSSAVNQTFPSVEILIAPNSANKHSLATIERFRREDPRIRLVPAADSADTALLDACLRAARSEYVIFLDSSELIREETAERLFTLAESANLDIAACGKWETWLHQPLSDPAYAESFADRAESVRIILREGIAGTLRGHLFRRSLFTDNGIMFPSAAHARLPALVDLYLAAEKVGMQPNHYFQRLPAPPFGGMLTPAKIADIFHTFDICRQHLLSRTDCWTMFRADYYAGMWRSIDILAGAAAAQEAEDEDSAGQLAKCLILSIVDRNLHAQDAIATIDDAMLRARIRSLFGGILYPPHLDFMER